MPLSPAAVESAIVALEYAILAYCLMNLKEECARAKLTYYRRNGTPVEVVEVQINVAACEIPSPEGASSLP